MSYLCPVHEEDESPLGDQQTFLAAIWDQGDYNKPFRTYESSDDEVGDELKRRGVKLTEGVL